MRQLKISKSITNSESSLTPEEEIELAKRARTGDTDALERLVNANLYLVTFIAQLHQDKYIALHELIIRGTIGLIRAAHKFNETCGFTFTGYALWWIRQALKQEFAENLYIKGVPIGKASAFTEVNRILTQVEQKYHHEPTAEDIASVLNIKGIDLNHTDLFTDTTIEHSSAVINPVFLQNELQNTLKNLTENEQQIIKLYFGLEGTQPLTLEEIAERLNLPKQDVQEIKNAVIQKIKRTTNPSRILIAYINTD